MYSHTPLFRVPVESEFGSPRKFDTGNGVPREIGLDASELPVEGDPLPVKGYNVELTRATFQATPDWWTLGFEAFGTVQTVENDLRAAATTMATRGPPTLEAGTLASYPAWLTHQFELGGRGLGG